MAVLVTAEVPGQTQEKYDHMLAVLILRALVTASGSDTPRPSALLCHGLGWMSSRSDLLLRRRGHAASPENLPALQPPLRDLRVV